MMLARWPWTVWKKAWMKRTNTLNRGLDTDIPYQQPAALELNAMVLFGDGRNGMVERQMIRHSLTVFVILIPLLSSQVKATEVQVTQVDVFTVDGLRYDVEGAQLAKKLIVPVHIRQIDEIYKLEMELSAGLPASEAEAAAIATKRFAKLSKKSVLDKYATTAESLTMARSLNVEKVPAVVFNKKWIVYGLDPLQAYSVFEMMRSRGELNGSTRGNGE
ncbi:DUF1525 domain-containing protein [Aeromonas caviae]|uniref:DUF1525 domain-containing protein n=1 Tax=Aeromonas caviae TaxID=648 RepID=UPI0029DE02B8|nr:DUF1525 domain-containing protein [Aeromonas caviae]MDX7767952.1 DUF1525 domain-containing protein [Aeromonas caviae]